jgi:hypothetical protein
VRFLPFKRFGKTSRRRAITGKIAARSNAVPAVENSRVTLSWETNDPIGGEVRVSTSGEEEKLVSRGQSGEVEIPWITSSTEYEFRLYAISQPDRRLDSAKVSLGVSAPQNVLRERTTNPIFIVSSGRSGSTILTWCLGQHPNIIPQEESNWLGPFAIDAAIGYSCGTVRGERGQLSANFIRREELLESFGNAINHLLLNHRKQFADPALRQRAGWNPPPFPISRSPSEPKSRWVDGTPEYSLYICALRKLFPRALFIHLIRDVTDVVRSLLNFFPDGTNRLVDSEQAAYEYWLRRANACAEAELAYGPQTVYRMRYCDLVGQPEATMRSLLEFLGEPYASECLEPLALRINSSNVPATFNPTEPATDPETVKRARGFSEQLLTSPQPREVSPEAAAKLETDFDRQVEYFATLEAKLNEVRTLVERLQNDRELLNTAPTG